MGKLDEAIADYDAAIKLQPKQAWSLYGRGLAKQKKGLAAEGGAPMLRAWPGSPEVKILAEGNRPYRRRRLLIFRAT
jgi:tetratricopeptide (TPR) repeat protein